MARKADRPRVALAIGAQLKDRVARLEEVVSWQHRELEIQLQRFAELQADLDAVHGAWTS